MAEMINKQRSRRKIGLFNIMLLVVLGLYAVSMFIPIFWGVMTALKSPAQFRLDKLGLPDGHIWQWQWENFRTVMENFVVRGVTRDRVRFEAGVGQMILHTLLYAGAGSFVNVGVTCLTAYLTVRFPCRLSKIICGIVIVTMILPIVGAYPAEIQMLQALAIYDTIPGSWLQKANFLGMYFLVFHALFRSQPKEYTEAAYIDGASELAVMVYVVFPLIRTTFLTVVLIKFIEFWNDYQTPLLYLPSHPTLAYGIYSLSNSTINNLNNVPMRMTGCVMMVMPILILFIVFRNRLIGNISMGGIKE